MRAFHSPGVPRPREGAAGQELWQRHRLWRHVLYDVSVEVGGGPKYLVPVVSVVNVANGDVGIPVAKVVSGSLVIASHHSMTG